MLIPNNNKIHNVMLKTGALFIHVSTILSVSQNMNHFIVGYNLYKNDGLHTYMISCGLLYNFSCVTFGYALDMLGHNRSIYC